MYPGGPASGVKSVLDAAGDQLGIGEIDFDIQGAGEYALHRAHLQGENFLIGIIAETPLPARLLALFISTLSGD